MRSTIGNDLHRTCKGRTHFCADGGVLWRDSELMCWTESNFIPKMTLLIDHNELHPCLIRVLDHNMPFKPTTQVHTVQTYISVPQIQFSAINLGGVLSICVRKHTHTRLPLVLRKSRFTDHGRWKSRADSFAMEWKRLF